MSPRKATKAAEAFAPIQTPARVLSALEWSPILREGRQVTFAQAEEAVAALGDDWRLPTRIELLSIIDETRCDPMIDEAVFGKTPSRWFWTSTPHPWVPESCRFVVSFGGGNVGGSLRLDLACVRAVRVARPGQ